MSHSRVTAVKTPKPIRATSRIVGDDWVFFGSTPADVSDWEHIVLQLRYKSDKVLIADSQGEAPGIILDGVNDPGKNLIVPESEYTSAGGKLYAVILRSVTSGIEPGRDLVLEGSVDAVSVSGRRTFIRAEFESLEQYTEESLP